MNSKDRIEKIDSFYFSILSVNRTTVNLDFIIKLLRSTFPQLLLQGINCEIVYGKSHLKEILKIVFELHRRKIGLALKIEIEILMRLSLSDQVTKAIKIGGLKNNCPMCFLLVSDDRFYLLKSIQYIENIFGKHHDRFIMPSKKKFRFICNLHNLKLANYNLKEFERLLIEKSALVGL
jgi:tRNA threonylcarbamoyladenosine modification (KEOPS) complex Cgi121 subunit